MVPRDREAGYRRNALLGSAIAVFVLLFPPADAQENARDWEVPVPESGGALTQWLVCGPFSSVRNTNPAVGLETDFLRGEAEARPQIGEEIEWEEKTNRWSKYQIDGSAADFDSLFGHSDHCAAYAYCVLISDISQRVVFGIGSDDAAKVWVNGRQVYSFSGIRGLRADRDLFPVELEPGGNHVLVKVADVAGPWGFVLRVHDPAQLGEAALQDPPETIGLSIDPPIASPGEEFQILAGTDPRLAYAENPPTVQIAILGSDNAALFRTETHLGLPIQIAPELPAEGVFRIEADVEIEGGEQHGETLFYFGDARTTLQNLDQALESLEPVSRENPTQLLLNREVELNLARCARWLDEISLEDIQETAIPQAGPALRSAEAFCRTLLDIERGVQGMRDRTDPFANLTGIQTRHYWSDIDDSLQPYGLAVPPHYSSAQEWPVVIVLHGYDRRNRNFYEQGLEEWMAALADDAWERDLIVAVPFGRGNTSYLGVGENDVFAVLRQIRSRFRVDPDRIYCMGYSMGGYGTWYLSALHPDLFAAAAPIMGGTDYRLWSGPLPHPVPRMFLDSVSPFNLAENYLLTPVFVHHGADDLVVDPRHSRNMVARLKGLAFGNVSYEEYPGVGHGGFPEEMEPKIFDWMVSHRRDQSPRLVRIKAGRLSSAQSYWGRIDRFDNPSQISSLEAVVGDEGNMNVQVSNVAAFTLDIRLSPIPAELVTLVINGLDTYVGRIPDDGFLSFYRGKVGDELRWRLGKHPNMNKAKRPGREGPMQAVFEGPFVVVYGTGEDREVMMAEAMQFAKRWWEWQRHAPRVRSDEALTRDEFRQFNLVLIGGPEQNSVSRQIWRQSPIELAESHVSLAGRRLEGENLGLCQVLPHPDNPERQVVIMAGTTPEAITGIASRFSILPSIGRRGYGSADFIVFDDRTIDWDTALAAGVFDPDWRVSSSLAHWGNEIERSEILPRKMPNLAELLFLQDEIRLSDLRPAARQSGGIVQFDRAHHGRKLAIGDQEFERGIGVVPPSEITYQLDGAASRFQATVGVTASEDGLAESEQEGARLIFRVWGDGYLLAQTSPLSWNSPPHEIDVAVSSVQELMLETVSPDERLRYDTGGCWGEARLVR